MISKIASLIKELHSSNQPVLIKAKPETVLSQISAELKMVPENISTYSSSEGIEQLRSYLIEALSRPLSDSLKLFVIKDVQALTAEQVNSILKILEEPPSHLRVVLFTENLSSVIKTIRSRCKIYALPTTSIFGANSIVPLLKKPFFEYSSIVSQLSKEEFGEALANGLEEMKKKGLNSDELSLYRFMVSVWVKVSNTNVNHKLLAESLYIKNKATT